MKMRPYQGTDLKHVVDLFVEAVHEGAREHYDPAQLSAWAPQPPDMSAWERRLMALEVVVAEEMERIVGFIAYEPNGHVDLLYVAPAFARRGIATMLYEGVEARLNDAGVSTLQVEASLVARPFFEAQGFRVREEQNASVRGSTLRRFAMAKQLAAAQQQVPRGAAALRRRP